MISAERHHVSQDQFAYISINKHISYQRSAMWLQIDLVKDVDCYLPGGAQEREMEWGPDTITLWGGGIPVGHETGVCITYLSLSPVPPPVLAPSSYTYLKKCGVKQEQRNQVSKEQYAGRNST